MGELVDKIQPPFAIGRNTPKSFPPRSEGKPKSVGGRAAPGSVSNMLLIPRYPRSAPPYGDPTTRTCANAPQLLNKSWARAKHLQCKMISVSQAGTHRCIAQVLMRRSARTLPIPG